MPLPIVYHKDVIEFITVAKEYIVFVDAPGTETKYEFVFKAQKILALLYLKTSLLPEFEDVFNEGNERFCTETIYNEVQNRVHKILRTNNCEVLINYDSQNLNEQEWVKLSEVFADIYQSLFDFLNLYRIGTEKMMNDALWECYHDFKILWGRKLLTILDSLHRMLYENLIIEDDNEQNSEIMERNTDSWFTEKLKNIDDN